MLVEGKLGWGKYRLKAGGGFCTKQATYVVYIVCVFASRLHVLFAIFIRDVCPVMWIIYGGI